MTFNIAFILFPDYEELDFAGPYEVMASKYIDTDWHAYTVAETPRSPLELYEGVLRSEDRRASERHLDALLDAIPLFPLSRSVARRCASVRHALKQAGKRVNSPALDLLIASTAIEHGLTLVTRNLAD
jgi:predicted nucleic acid-binding protein